MFPAGGIKKTNKTAGICMEEEGAKERAGDNFYQGL